MDLRTFSEDQRKIESELQVCRWFTVKIWYLVSYSEGTEGPKDDVDLILDFGNSVRDGTTTKLTGSPEYGEPGDDK